MNDYQEFLNKKLVKHLPAGFDINESALNQTLFDWQKVATKWSIKMGRSAMFEDCGLGKTLQQLEWASQIYNQTGENILILAPLAVSQQTKGEGEKMGISVTVCRKQGDVQPGINITNYEMVDHFDPEKFVGVVLDESSILKSFMGKTKTKLFNMFRQTQFKLCATATPAPNDYMELLNQADFLGIMPSTEALARWFINDTMNFGSYRIKGHAMTDFWRWVASWAVCINKPSDIGFSDVGYELPELKSIKHVCDYDFADYENGNLFKNVKPGSATDLYKNLRETAEQRTDMAASTINESNDLWVAWCNTNNESKLLRKKINGGVEVKGSMSSTLKESILKEFADGKIKCLVTKPSICGWGLNWQHVHHSASVGLSYSFEQRYQALRRFYRFGQKNTVYDHIFLSPVEASVYRTIQRKEQQYAEMGRQMVNCVKDYQEVKNNRLDLQLSKESVKTVGKKFELILGDSCQEIKKIKSDSIDFIIFSPPFSNLYIYSDSIADMGNCKDDDEFFTHFKFLIPELYRIATPGRLCAIHCKDLVNYKNKDGKAGLRDFPGEIIRAMECGGWQYHSRVTIWKDPVIEMQRTKSQGLLHAQIKRDTSMSRQGLPDYLLVFRKWPGDGETSGPNPILREKGFIYYIGDNAPDCEKKEGDEYYSISVWQRYASPVWFDIQQTNVLNCRIAREDQDEKHICPLQLDLIARAIDLWSLEGDTVFSPFAGIGSEGYQALTLNRKFIGIELKQAYYDQAVKYLEYIEQKPEQMELFK